jgi:hypothetical protein
MYCTESQKEKNAMKEKHKRSLVSVWAWCLCVFLVLVAGCNIQTSSLPPAPSPAASEPMRTSPAIQGTADVILNLVGTYVGTYHWHGSNSSSPMRLEITQEDAGSLSGFCILGERSFPLLEGFTTFEVGTQGEDGLITFMVNVPSGQQTIALNFRGVATKEGSMTGEVSASDGREGNWSVKKT